MFNTSKNEFVKKSNCLNVFPYENIPNLMRNLVTNHEQNPFFLFNVDDTIFKYNLWKEVLPRVQPHYAVKCNNCSMVLRVLAALGTNFDCATEFEMQQVISLGVDPSRIIYAHTTKMLTCLKYAKENNINLITFDNEEELYKMKQIYPEARIIIRIKYDGKAMCKFGVKFGCDPYTEAEKLLQVAFNLNMNVVGVSFHTGSELSTPSTLYDAIKAAHHVFQCGLNLGFDLNVLDIGGGYPGEHGYLLLPYSNYINMALEEYFPNTSVTIIAEPGTYFVKSAFTLACSVHSLRKNHLNRDEVDKRALYDYYLTDGVFGNMSAVLSNYFQFIPKLLVTPKENNQYLSTFWGPTCDPVDRIKENMYFPKLKIGDWIIFDEMGSYTFVVASRFHGFQPSPIYSVIGEKNWMLIKDKLSLVSEQESRTK
ncbi:hypothetical protein FQA39_LY09449 [Lamprigera yunnana]|nr:hypothetical protein FQA39_LY09449 [Lamprigera yunnana]